MGVEERTSTGLLLGRKGRVQRVAQGGSATVCRVARGVPPEFKVTPAALRLEIGRLQSWRTAGRHSQSTKSAACCESRRAQHKTGGDLEADRPAGVRPNRFCLHRHVLACRRPLARSQQQHSDAPPSIPTRPSETEPAAYGRVRLIQTRSMQALHELSRTPLPTPRSLNRLLLTRGLELAMLSPNARASSRPRLETAR